MKLFPLQQTYNLHIVNHYNNFHCGNLFLTTGNCYVLNGSKMQPLSMASVTVYVYICRQSNSDHFKNPAFVWKEHSENLAEEVKISLNHC